MVRETSIEAYNTIVANGLLSKRRLEVYKFLYNNGARTQNEVARHYEIYYPGSSARTWGARFSELKNHGVIKEVGVKVDDITGHKGILWDVTANLPKPIVKKVIDKKVIDNMVFEKTQAQDIRMMDKIIIKSHNKIYRGATLIQRVRSSSWYNVNVGGAEIIHAIVTDGDGELYNMKPTDTVYRLKEK